MATSAMNVSTVIVTSTDGDPCGGKGGYVAELCFIGADPPLPGAAGLLPPSPHRRAGGSLPPPRQQQNYYRRQLCRIPCRASLPSSVFWVLLMYVRVLCPSL